MEYSSRFRSYLNEIYLEKKKKNPSFSKRAFAKLLGVPSSYLIRIMNGVLPVTESLLNRMVIHLGIPDNQVLEFVEEIKTNRLNIDEHHFIGKARKEVCEVSCSPDLVGLLENWKWFCVLELSRLDDFELSEEYISKKLGIDFPSSRKLIDYTISRKIFDCKGNVCVKNVEDFLLVTGIGSDGLAKLLRERHKKLLKEIEWSIDGVEQGKRHMQSLVIAYDSDLYGEICKKIARFRKELIVFLEKKSKKRDTLCDLSINLIPLTKE